MSHDSLDRLAEFVANLRTEDPPPETASAAKDVVLDTIGAITAGNGLTKNANVAQLPAGTGAPGKPA